LASDRGRRPDRTAAAQYWGTAGSADDEALAQLARQRGNKLVLSPADKTYLDMKYDASTPIGQDWAGYTKRQRPATTGIRRRSCPAWPTMSPAWRPVVTDVFPTWDDVEYMAFRGCRDRGNRLVAGQHAFVADYRVRWARRPEVGCAGDFLLSPPEVPWPTDRFS